MLMADAERMIRARLDDPDLQKKWAQMLKDRGTSQQRAISSFVSWIVEQDPLLQVMLFRQVPERDNAELATMVLRRLTDSAGTKRGKGK